MFAYTYIFSFFNYLALLRKAKRWPLSSKNEPSLFFEMMNLDLFCLLAFLPNLYVNFQDLPHSDSLCHHIEQCH